MKAGPIGSIPPGEQRCTRPRRPTFLRLPAAGAPICAAPRVGSYAATL